MHNPGDASSKERRKSEKLGEIKKEKEETRETVKKEKEETRMLEVAHKLPLNDLSISTPAADDWLRMIVFYFQ